MFKFNTLFAALLMGAAVSAQAAAPHKIAYLTSWGLDDPAALEQSAVDTYMLSFAQWDEKGDIATSDDIATMPKYDPYWMSPGYTAWTNLKRNNPQRKILLAFGGQTYEHIWSHIQTPESREILAKKLVELMNTDFPVYTKNLTAEQISGECLDFSWNGSCNLNNYQKAGAVQLDGIDFDFEKTARITPQESADLLALVTRVRALAPSKILSLTTYHVGADPEECANSGVIENCSFIETDRSAHHGEVSELLVQSKDIFNFFNVMAYDAGRNFKYQVALQNYAKKIGDKSKIVMGNTINAQWSSTGPFVETDENNIARAKWQSQNGYGGIFVWSFGASTQQLSMATQVAKVNDMIAAMTGSESPVTPEVPEVPVVREELVSLTNNADIRAINVATLSQRYKTISVVTRDGAWVGSFELPATGIPEGTVLKFQRNASYNTDIISPIYGVDTPLPGESRTYTYSNGAWQSDKFTINKQSQLSLIGNKQNGLNQYFTKPLALTIRVADGSWVQNIYLPATAAEGASVKLIRDSSWATNLFANGKSVQIPRGTSITYRFKEGVWQPNTLNMTYANVINALNTSPAAFKQQMLDAQKTNAVIQITP